MMVSPSILGTAGSWCSTATVHDVRPQGEGDEVVLAAQAADGLNVTADDEMTALHIDNFVDAIRTGSALRQPIEEGAKSVLLGHLGNIAQSTGRSCVSTPRRAASRAMKQR